MLSLPSSSHHPRLHYSGWVRLRLTADWGCCQEQAPLVEGVACYQGQLPTRMPVEDSNSVASPVAPAGSNLSGIRWDREAASALKVPCVRADDDKACFGRGAGVAAVLVGASSRGANLLYTAAADEKISNSSRGEVAITERTYGPQGRLRGYLPC